jgi:uncharacterized membrane protein YfcA
MAVDDALLVVLGAFAGGFVTGLAGFGTGLIALGFWLHAIEPPAAASLVIVCSVVSQTQTIFRIRHAIVPARIWPFLVFGLAGVPVGARLVTQVDPGAFKLAVGLLLLAFSAVMTLGKARPRVSWGGRPADGAVGFMGGILGGLAGLSGPLPTMWATLRGWGKDEKRGVFQTFNLVVLGAALIAHALSGLLTPQVGWLVALALPGTLSGSWLGERAYRRLSDQRFHEVVLCALGLSGLALIWSAWP